MLTGLADLTSGPPEWRAPAPVPGGRRRPEYPVTDLRVTVYRIPTESPESDGTLEWNATTMVLVQCDAGGMTGLGYSYTDASAAMLIQDLLDARVRHRDALEIPAIWQTMVHSIRNLGRPGLCSSAIAAVDAALWDLKGRLLGLPVATLLGPARSRVPLYGSGGFTSYTESELCRQLARWADQGFRWVKMKVGRDPAADPSRVRAARRAIGSGTGLFVDANGAYPAKTALHWAEAFGEADVTWFEEPVSSDDLAGLALVRQRAPAGMDIAAGEYGYDLPYFQRMLSAGAVDVLQADATRCAGLTGFLAAGALAQGFQVPFSAHTAPAVHLHPCCALPGLVHLEYFHDHARIESLLFEGVATPEDGCLAPDLSRPGLGFDLKVSDAIHYQR